MPLLVGNCTEACGWIAAVIATVAWGSFGVPVKSKHCTAVDVDPLVMQSYKTAMCFVTFWLVVFMGEEPRFTPWGILSGIFWVPGAAAGIYGIRNAGLAIAVGTWSSIIVMTSFCWGIFVFEEKVRSVWGAYGATLLLISGLIGMSRYSNPALQQQQRQQLQQSWKKELLLVETGDEFNSDSSSSSSDDDDSDDQHDVSRSPSKKGGAAMALKRKRVIATKGRSLRATRASSFGHDERIKIKGGGTTPPSSSKSFSDLVPLEMEPLVVGDGDEEGASISLSAEKDAGAIALVLLNGRVVLTRRQLGIIGAVFNGTWGGSNLIPMHYAKNQGFSGAGYMISFACGAALVNAFLWVFRYLYHVYRTRGSYREAFDSLPSFHLRKLWFYGVMAGLLYSVGNFCSIIAVSFLGQGVGYSFCQCAMLVSGLWGIFYFKEIKGEEIVSKWFASAFLTLAGILWLSYEHQGDGAH